MTHDKNLMKLVERLGSEVSSVKSCFTEFSFKTLAISAIGLGLIFKFQEGVPIVSLSAILIFGLCLTVARIGNYKYGTANRISGYELHLNRLKNIYDRNNNFAINEFYEVGWEEAMKAWRVVQATVFDYLFWTGFMKPNILKKEHRNEEDEKKWFEPKVKINEESKFHSGGYLGSMQFVLHIVAGLSLLPIYFASTSKNGSILSSSHYLSIFIILLVIWLWRVIKTGFRRKLLEEGFLSIYSCSIMWHAVILAHFIALDKAFKDSKCHKDYIVHLSKVAVEIKENTFHIHDWINKTSEDLKLYK